MAEPVEGQGGLPPKLDLRRSGVLKASPAPVSSAVPVKSEAPLSPAVPVARPPVFAQATAQTSAVQPPVAVAAPKPTTSSISPAVLPNPPAGVTGPKPVLIKPFVPGAATPAMAVPPAPPPPVAPQPSVVFASTATAQAKKETSRIPLESASPSPPPPQAGQFTPSSAPKTIRIKPGSSPVKPGDVSPSAPTVAKTSPTPEAVGFGGLSDKRKTSRISLGSILAGDDKDKAGDQKGPKTIKLKRPSEAVTVKAPKPADGTVSVDFSKTAKLDETAIEEGTLPQAGRRTIKVKRPDASGVAARTHAEQAKQEVYVDTAHWTFWAFALLTILVVSVGIYMFCAQVLGPDYCLTRYSYKADAWDMGWPGKLHRGL
jgi:hypothetical protein